MVFLVKFQQGKLDTVLLYLHCGEKNEISLLSLVLLHKFSETNLASCLLKAKQNPWNNLHLVKAKDIKKKRLDYK